MISLSLNFEIVARHYFEGFYSRDFNRQLLNKGIKFHDLRFVNFILFFKMTPNLFLQFYSFWGYVKHASITVLLFLG